MSSSSTQGSALVAEVIDNGPVSAQQIIVVVLCLLLNMLDGFDITAMAVTVHPIGEELGLTEDKLGFVFSFALAGMMLGAMVLAAVSDLIGRRRTILLSILLIGSTVFLTGYANSLWELIVLRFMSGLGAGAMLASQATLAAEYSSERFRALSVAAVTAGYPLGAVLTGAVAGTVIPEFGWRGMFFLGGGLTLFMWFAAFLLIPESLQFLVEKRPPNALERVNGILIKLKRDKLDGLPDLPPKEKTATPKLLDNMLSLLSEQHRTRTLTLWVTFFFCFSTLYFLMSWIPKLVINAGFSSEMGHSAFLLFNLGGVIGIFLLGTLSTKFKLTRLVCFFLLSSAFGMVVFAMAPAQQTLILGLIFIIGIMQQGGFTGLYGVATKIYPTDIRSTGVGWAIGLGRFGAVIGPAIAGFTIASGVSMSGNFIIFAI
ncbi:MAG: MFS transporter, partial [Pseudomonadota bacterium]